MNKKQNLTGLFLLVAVSLLLGSCAGQQVNPTTAPTLDANVIYTQAAQTVQAGQALTQAAKPPTQAPTMEIAPTFTMDANMASALTATANAVLQPGAPTPTTQAGALTPTATLAAGLTPIVLPTATKAAVKPPAATGDLCEWVSNSPADNAKLTKNSLFDATIKVKNSGTTTWDNRYALYYWSGERMGAPSSFNVQNEVKPNEVYTFQFEMKTPDTIGKKEVNLVVENPDGRVMCVVNLPYEIID
jgi:hypothetical protein